MSGAGLFSAQFLTRQTAWAVCLVFFAICTAAGLQAQPRRYRPLPEYVQIGKPDQNKGAAILNEFRKKGVYAGDNYFEFVLKVMPRRGSERTVPGRLWTGDTDKGPVSRFVLFPGVAGQEQRLLVQSGPGGGEVRAWHAGQGDAPGDSAPRLFARLADTDVTAFDLQMAYLHWPEFVYEGTAKVRGRPADAFLLYPPDQVAEASGQLTGVRVYLDAQYGAPVQAEYIGENGKPFKSVSVVDLKKVGEQWVVKSIDFRDEVSRNKTRFSLTGAAVGLDHAGSMFTPEMLKESIRPPPQDAIVPVAP